MTQCLSVREALEFANITGQQVNITLKSGTELEGVIVERLWRSSFRVWLEPAERVEKGQDVDKAIVATHAVASPLILIWTTLKMKIPAVKQMWINAAWKASEKH